MTAAHKTQTKVQAWSSLVFHCRHSSFYPSEAPPWDSRPVSGASVVHYHLLHRPRSIPTALGPAPLITLSFFQTEFVHIINKRDTSFFRCFIHWSWLALHTNQTQILQYLVCFVLVCLVSSLLWESARICLYNITNALGMWSFVTMSIKLLQSRERNRNGASEK